jgi:hypothetical protein
MDNCIQGILVFWLWGQEAYFIYKLSNYRLTLKLWLNVENPNTPPSTHASESAALVKAHD